MILSIPPITAHPSTFIIIAIRVTLTPQIHLNPVLDLPTDPLTLIMACLSIIIIISVLVKEIKV